MELSKRLHAGAGRTRRTLLQRNVKTSELDHLYAAVTKVLATENPRSWKLKAIKYQYFPDKSIRLANIVVEPTPDLRRLQAKLIEAEKPFEVPTGKDATFVTTREDPTIIPQPLPYVADFVPKYSGDNYRGKCVLRPRTEA